MTWTSQKILAAVKLLACDKGCVKLAAIVKHSGLKNRQVADACATLVKHDYLVRQHYSDGAVKPGCFVITKLGLAALDQGARLTSGPKGPTGRPNPRANSLRERAWRSLRIRRKASIPELVGLLLDAGTPAADVERAENNLHKYIRPLVCAGYLVEMRREAPQSLTSNGAKRYLLVRDTGPLPPLHQPSTQTVYDQNEEKQYDAKRT